ncbi:MAG: hypothetical protein NT027_14120 [Proteobacteria bacterium]|nr:hypothetical protein [Pseudomonadota bacterium]
MVLKTFSILFSSLTFFGTIGFSQLISIQNQTIVACRDLRVKYSAVAPTSSAKGHWITIADESQTDVAQSYRFKYLPANTRQGEINLSTRGLNPFSTYEIRLYLDWEGTRSYTVAARQSFNIQSSNNCLAPLFGDVETEVSLGNPVNFSFSDLKLSTSNWVSLARPNSTAPNSVRTIKLPATSEGQFAIPTAGLAPGKYELRLFEDWDATKEYYIYDRVMVTIK